jgi:transcriptional regulator with PAS, ATPase and Fis domain
MTENRLFRADLFYRISVVPIELPPLRERPDDVRSLAQHFAMDYAARMHKPVKGISEDFMDARVRYSWPGNIPELLNCIERSLILSTGNTLDGSLAELTGIIPESSARKTAEDL